ncbi:MAG: formimidoylglutamase [Chitinophagaceae bacterium]|nr:formimidoylglutamase [Chitinophagaceae bacterium]
MYKKTEKNIWVGRYDVYDGELGYRWHNCIQFIDIENKESFPGTNFAITNVAFLGFCCDEGVSRNRGRIGASHAPNIIRKFASNLAWHYDTNVKIFDAGNVFCDNGILPESQELLGNCVDTLLKNNIFPILLGGGHEIAYGNFLGIYPHIKRKKLAILNIDAHFDMRKDPNTPTSGTSFLQISDFLKNKKEDFHYYCFGIQRFANTKALFQEVKNKEVTFLEAQTLLNMSIQNIQQYIQETLTPFEAVYLSIDMDSIDSAFAPGVSAPCVQGLYPHIVSEIIKTVLKTKKVISVDIAELNPEFDIDNRTARLSSTFLFDIINSSVL